MEKEKFYILLMKKENALDILSGKKKIEVRQSSDYYEKMFCDKKKLEAFYAQFENWENKKDFEQKMWLTDTLKDDGIKTLRFTNYNRTWFLDVEIENKFYDTFCEYTKQILNEKYNFHDWDDAPTQEEIAKRAEQGEKNLPNVIDFFAFVLGKVIDTDLTNR